MEQLRRAVVTGPTGVLGTALLKQLDQIGVETFCVCNPASKRARSISETANIHKVFCDLREIGKLSELISTSCDAFFHLAWLGTQDPGNRLDMYLQTENIRFSLDAVQAAKNLKCKVFIGAGSQAEYGPVNGPLAPNTPTHPVSGYGMAKLCSGQMTRFLCKDYGIRHIWPRIVSTYGENDAPHTLINTVINKLLAGEKPSLTAGEQIWDYLYADDAADALYRMAVDGKDGAVYVLGSGQPKPMKEFIRIIRDSIDSKLPVGLGEIPYYKDQAMHLEADISTLTQDTGWLPTTSFQEGIAALIAARRSRL